MSYHGKVSSWNVLRSEIHVHHHDHAFLFHDISVIHCMVVCYRCMSQMLLGSLALANALNYTSIKASVIVQLHLGDPFVFLC